MQLQGTRTLLWVMVKLLLIETISNSVANCSPMLAPLRSICEKQNLSPHSGPIPGSQTTQAFSAPFTYAFWPSTKFCLSCAERSSLPKTWIALTSQPTRTPLEEPAQPPSSPCRSVTDVANKLEYIQKLLNYWTQVKPDPEFTPTYMSSYLPVLSEAFYFEDVMNYTLSKCVDAKSEIRRAKLKQISSSLGPALKHYRTKAATSKLKALLTSLLKGPKSWEEALHNMFMEQKADVHLMQLIEAKIQESHMLYASGNSASISEKILNIIKESCICIARILAEKLMEDRGVATFLRILSLCLMNDITKKDYRKILKSNLNRIEDIERFHEWIQNGIDYAESSNTLSDMKISTMKRLMKELESINPVLTQSLDRQRDIDTFTPHEINLEDTIENS